MCELWKVIAGGWYDCPTSLTEPVKCSVDLG